MIACPPAKLLYRGTLDFDQRVDAKVEGLILSDIAGVGPLFGLVLRPLTKLMEFKVTGTLANVNAQPLYVLPKLLLLPLQPFKALRSLFGDNAPGPVHPPAGTNAPALPAPFQAPIPDGAPATNPPAPPPAPSPSPSPQEGQPGAPPAPRD